jgi:hypothetical protein
MENAMQFLNLTPHDVHVYDAAGARIIWTFSASGSVARIATSPQADAGKVEVCWLHAAETTCSGDFVPEGKDRAYSSDQGPGSYEVIPLVTAPDFAAGTVTGIPPWAHGTDEAGCPYALIVGQLGAEAVARAFSGAVFATDTGPASVVRDAKGNILGVKRLILVSRGR